MQLTSSYISNQVTLALAEDIGPGDITTDYLVPPEHAGQGRIIAKEGADGLLGMAIEHPEFPDGLGVVIKIAHGWNPRATWYIARGILGTLGFALRNPYQLFKQKAFLVPGVVPEDRLSLLEKVPTWDDWDPDRDRWMFEWDRYAPERGL